MAKSALEKLSQQIAVEYHNDGIIAVAFRLGFVETPLTAKSSNDKYLDPYKRRMLLSGKPIAHPSEIAAFMSTIIDCPQRYMNGSIIDLDAGICIQ